MTHSEARERVLDAAEALFTRRGYTAVTLKDIAAALKMKHASLYHHVESKEALFIEVMERTLLRHQAGINQAITDHAGDLRRQLHAIADWMLSHPPMDFVRLANSDMPEIIEAEGNRLSHLALVSMIEPIVGVLAAAAARGDIEHEDLGLVGGGLFGLIQSLHAVPSQGIDESREAMAHKLIDVFIRGLVK